MNTFMAWAMGQDARAKGNKMKVFDWDMLANRIKDYIDEVDRIEAFLECDRGNTNGCIFSCGSPVNDGWAYLASIWATPRFEITWKNGVEEGVDCWRYQEDTPGWDAKTVWPDSALDILGLARKDVVGESDYYTKD